MGFFKKKTSKPKTKADPCQKKINEKMTSKQINAIFAETNNTNNTMVNRLDRVNVTSDVLAFAHVIHKKVPYILGIKDHPRYGAKLSSFDGVWDYLYARVTSVHKDDDVAYKLATLETAAEAYRKGWEIDWVDKPWSSTNPTENESINHLVWPFITPSTHAARYSEYKAALKKKETDMTAFVRSRIFEVIAKYIMSRDSCSYKNSYDLQISALDAAKSKSNKTGLPITLAYDIALSR